MFELKKECTFCNLQKCILNSSCHRSPNYRFHPEWRRTCPQWYCAAPVSVEASHKTPNRHPPVFGIFLQSHSGGFSYLLSFPCPGAEIRSLTFKFFWTGLRHEIRTLPCLALPLSSDIFLHNSGPVPIVPGPFAFVFRVPIDGFCPFIHLPAHGGEIMSLHSRLGAILWITQCRTLGRRHRSWSRRSCSRRCRRTRRSCGRRNSASAATSRHCSDFCFHR